MNSLGIIGAGIMGTDIAHLAAEAGCDVMLFDIVENKSKEAINKIHERLNRYVKQGKIDPDRVNQIIAKIKISDSINEFSHADIVIECITEDINAKKNLFIILDKICKPGAVLASNTSSISITEIASVTKRPESVIGLHFLNPARSMKIVEIIPGLTTTRETFELAKTFIKKLGKIYVESRDFPGFLLNRMLFPMINEAIFLLYEGAATVESIDKVMKTGLNLPMGPLALADMIGLDIVLAVADEMYRDYSDPKYRPCPLLKKYVSAGYLGKKSGRGFYIY